MARPKNKKERLDIHDRKLLRLYQKTKSRYGSGAYFDATKDRILRYDVASPVFKRYLKRRCSKRARKALMLSNGSHYKRTFDYWWKLY